MVKVTHHSIQSGTNPYIIFVKDVFRTAEELKEQARIRTQNPNLDIKEYIEEKIQQYKQLSPTNEEAIKIKNEVFGLKGPFIYNYIKPRIGINQKVSIEDIFSEAYLHIDTAFNKYNPHKSNFSTYLGQYLRSIIYHKRHLPGEPLASQPRRKAIAKLHQAEAKAEKPITDTQEIVRIMEVKKPETARRLVAWQNGLASVNQTTRDTKPTAINALERTEELTGLVAKIQSSGKAGKQLVRKTDLKTAEEQPYIPSYAELKALLGKDLFKIVQKAAKTVLAQDPEYSGFLEAKRKPTLLQQLSRIKDFHPVKLNQEIIDEIAKLDEED